MDKKSVSALWWINPYSAEIEKIPAMEDEHKIVMEGRMPLTLENSHLGQSLITLGLNGVVKQYNTFESLVARSQKVIDHPPLTAEHLMTGITNEAEMLPADPLYFEDLALLLLLVMKHNPTQNICDVKPEKVSAKEIESIQKASSKMSQKKGADCPSLLWDKTFDLITVPSNIDSETDAMIGPASMAFNTDLYSNVLREIIAHYIEARTFKEETGLSHEEQAKLRKQKSKKFRNRLQRTAFYKEYGEQGLLRLKIKAVYRESVFKGTIIKAFMSYNLAHAPTQITDLYKQMYSGIKRPACIKSEKCEALPSITFHPYFPVIKKAYDKMFQNSFLHDVTKLLNNSEHKNEIAARMCAVIDWYNAYRINNYYDDKDKSKRKGHYSIIDNIDGIGSTNIYDPGDTSDRPLDWEPELEKGKKSHKDNEEDYDDDSDVKEVGFVTDEEFYELHKQMTSTEDTEDSGDGIERDNIDGEDKEETASSNTWDKVSKTELSKRAIQGKASKEHQKKIEDITGSSDTLFLAENYLNELPQQQKDVVCRIVIGQSISDIARATGKAPATVSESFQAALKNMQKMKNSRKTP